MQRTERVGGLFANLETLEEHLAMIGLPSGPARMLLHLYHTSRKADGQSVRQVSLLQLARELGVSRQTAINWRNDLWAYRFLDVLEPAQGRTRIIVCDWSTVLECRRLPDAPIDVLEQVQAANRVQRNAATSRPAHGQTDGTNHSQTDSTTDGTKHGQKHSTTDSTIPADTLLEGESERKKEGSFNHSSEGAKSLTPWQTAKLIPSQALNPTITGESLYALLRTWKIEHGIETEPRVVVAAVLATRNADDVRLPVSYLARCLTSPEERWLVEADRWLAKHRSGLTYAAHGLPK